MPKRPNILIICSDQQHWRMNSVNGHPLVRTPNLARLAAMGTNFRCCYSNSPVCVPARAALMTGRYPHEIGAYDNGAPFDGRAPTFANLARDQGYFCTAAGKLDLWEGKDYGFREVGTAHGHEVSPDVTAFFRNPMCFKGTGLSTPESVVRQGPLRDRSAMQTTREFLLREAGKLDQPWLAWTGWNAPHNPYRTTPDMLALYPREGIDTPSFPENWRDREHPVMAMTRYHRGLLAELSPEQVRLERQAYYGLITEVDSLVGELLAALEQSGQLEHTVVIFTSDHGDMMGEHGFFHKNAPYDGCARVPLIAAGPGFAPGRVVETPVSQVDLCATLMDLAGAPAPAEVRGVSLLPLARGEGEGPPFAYVELNTERLITGVFTIVEGGWKYNHYVGYPDQLFCLDEDPCEWDDRIDDPACEDVRERLRRRLFSIVDPERVNREAFADQARRLAAFIGPRSLEQILSDREFFGHFSRRLGDEQARELLARHFRTQGG